MHIKIRNKIWELVREEIQELTEEGEEMKGYCEPASKKSKKIVVDSRLKDREELEILIHEMLHASQWDLDETVVQHSAEDFAKVLWKLGYRKDK